VEAPLSRGCRAAWGGDGRRTGDVDASPPVLSTGVLKEMPRRERLARDLPGSQSRYSRTGNRRSGGAWVYEAIERDGETVVSPLKALNVSLREQVRLWIARFQAGRNKHPRFTESPETL
jgi:hypothetical protein